MVESFRFNNLSFLKQFVLNHGITGWYFCNEDGSVYFLEYSPAIDTPPVYKSNRWSIISDKGLHLYGDLVAQLEQPVGPTWLYKSFRFPTNLHQDYAHTGKETLVAEYCWKQLHAFTPEPL